MRLHLAVLLLVLHCLAEACEPEQIQSGCKISEATCACGMGCKSEYVYKTRRACQNALRGHGPNPIKCDDLERDVLKHYLTKAPTITELINIFPLSTPPTERSSNVCYRVPCLRGICIQTVQDPGFACRCESTGYYGQRCEKACPTVAVRGLVFPHECIVI